MIAIIISVVVTTFIGIVLYLSAKSKPKPLKNSDEPEQVGQFCQESLNGKDREVALAAGRIYYSFENRNRSLGIHEELAIANDLSTMPLETYTSNKRL